MRLSFQFFLTVLVVWPARYLSAQNSNEMDQLKQFQEMIDKPVVYRIKATNDTKSYRNLKYCESTDREMDIYTPSDSQMTTRPCILLIHGKTPFPTDPKNWGVYISWGKLLASEGFICSVFTNSLAKPQRTLDEAGSDIQEAIKYLKDHANTYQIDTNRMAVISFSAGSPLLCKVIGLEGIKCLVVFYGFMNITNTSVYGPADKHIRSRYSLDHAINSIPNFPPIFIARAGLEFNEGLNRTIDEFILAAAARNLNFSVANHALGVHGFDSQNDDERSKEIIEEMIVFLKHNLQMSK